MNGLTWLRRSPRLAVVIVVAGLAVVATAVAFAATAPAPAIQTSTPHFADQVTNIDVLRQQIRNYYGDPLGTGVFGADSNYAREAGFVADQGGHWLAARAHAHYPSGMKAIVLDVGRHHARHLELRGLQQLGVQPDHERRLRQRREVPGGSRHGRHGPAGEGRGLHDHLDHGPARDAGGADAREPDQDGRRLPGAYGASHCDAGRRCGRPLHEAGRRRLPVVPADRVRRRDRGRQVVHDHRTTSRRRGATSSRSATRSSPTSATSSATSPAASRTARSRCRTRTTSCRRRARRCQNRRMGAAPEEHVVVVGYDGSQGAEAALARRARGGAVARGHAARRRCVACAGAARRRRRPRPRLRLGSARISASR